MKVHDHQGVTVHALREVLAASDDFCTRGSRIECRCSRCVPPAPPPRPVLDWFAAVLRIFALVLLAALPAQAQSRAENAAAVLQRCDCASKFNPRTVPLPRPEQQVTIAWTSTQSGPFGAFPSTARFSVPRVNVRPAFRYPQAVPLYRRR